MKLNKTVPQTKPKNYSIVFMGFFDVLARFQFFGIKNALKLICKEVRLEIFEWRCGVDNPRQKCCGQHLNSERSEHL